jgi:CRISPR-associated protein Cmr6
MAAKNVEGVPLPATIRSLLNLNTHPGLELDKYAATVLPANAAGKWQELVQRPTVEHVSRLSQSPPPDLNWRALCERRSAILKAVGANVFTCTTIGPLTLHLSRASALENAGICLHPLYGFAYLPGSGLKGMARAYAETVWLPTQANKQQAWRLIEDIFGWAPGSDKGKDWKPDGIPDRAKQDNAHVGNIVFHDAWPTEWPRLIVDIVNNHHPDYYQAKPDNNTNPPGDWENPNPVYFLAVPSGTRFDFALSLRRTGIREELHEQANEWLMGALCQLGAGAKTAAGYGSFRPAKGSPPALPSPSRKSFEATLELVTPGFLAGASQQAADCDLRSATLRGLLRWWWRTMHAGYVDVATLRRLEAALWGDTSGGAAIRIELLPVRTDPGIAYNKHAVAKGNSLPKPPNQKTTQGLWYHSFGMHDGGKQRHYLKPGNKWKLIFTVRDAAFVFKDGRGRPIPGTARMIDKDIVLDQALAALWWLCALGGAGSKSRKGFGNFANPSQLDPFYGARFVSKGKLLRAACGVSENAFKAEWSGGAAALRQMVDLGRKVRPDGNGWIELYVSTTNVWQALDRVGMLAQKFAQDRKHRREKKGLGMPRKIGHPAQGQFQPGPGVNDRHASPIHYHLHSEGNGFVLRVAAFPSARLPNLQASEILLEELLRYFAAIDTL